MREIEVSHGMTAEAAIGAIESYFRDNYDIPNTVDFDGVLNDKGRLAGVLYKCRVCNNSWYRVSDLPNSKDAVCPRGCR